MARNEQTIGKFNEEGLVSNLVKMGMEPDLALKELIANSIDADATLIHILKETTKTIIKDNGCGMSIENIENMFDAFRENHSQEKKLGVSGVGGKLASLNLSEDSDGSYTPVIIYTNGKNGCFKIIIPWDKIMKEKTYTNQVKFYKLNDEVWLKAKFGESTGTIYEFKNTKNINDVVLEQFEHPQKLKIDKQIGFIFGGFKSLSLNYNGKEIKKYNYFGDGDSKYIIKQTTTIATFQTNKGIEYYFEKESRYYDTDGKEKNMRMYKKESTMRLVCGCRNTRNNKQGEKPMDMSDMKNFLEDKEMDGFARISDYDSKFNDFNQDYDNLTEPFSNTSLVRNGQHIAGINIRGFKHSSARANNESSLKICGVRSELYYETNSDQSNPMDKELGIQLNKNQHSQKIPPQLEKIIKWCRTKCFMDLKETIKSLPSIYSSPEPSPGSSSETSPETLTETLPSPEKSTGLSTETLPSTETSPEKSTGLSTETLPSPETSSEPSPEPSTETSPEKSTETSPEPSTETSPEKSTGLSTETSPEKSTGLSTETLTETLPSPETSSETSPEPSTETLTETLPSPETPPGPIISRHQKGPLSYDHIKQIQEMLSNNTNEVINNRHLISFYNEICM
jgi:hypothetical protein